MWTSSFPGLVWHPVDEAMVESYSQTEVPNATKRYNIKMGLLAQHTMARLIEERVPELQGLLWPQSVHNSWHPRMRYGIYDFGRIDVKSTSTQGRSIQAECNDLQLSLSREHIEDNGRPDDLIVLQTINFVFYRKTVALCWATMGEIRSKGKQSPAYQAQWLLAKEDAHPFEDLLMLLKRQARFAVSGALGCTLYSDQ